MRKRSKGFGKLQTKLESIKWLKSFALILVVNTKKANYWMKKTLTFKSQ